MAKQGSKTHRPPSEPPSLTKVATGIAGLDDILEGGFPAGRTTLISAGPGTGKTMLGLEFLYKSALAGKAGILLLFEERADATRRNVRSLGWDLAAMEKAGKLFILEARLPRDAVLSGDFNITTLMTNQLAGNFERIDFSGIGFSSLIDTIILLRFVEIYNKITRSLLVLKSRGTKHSNSYHRFVITDHGIEMTTIPSGARLSETYGQPLTERSHAEAGTRKGGER